MTRRDCRDCGTGVSASAEKCPECGAPYPAESEKVARQSTAEESAGADAQAEGVAVGCLWVMGIGVVLAIAWFLLSV